MEEVQDYDANTVLLKDLKFDKDKESDPVGFLQKVIKNLDNIRNAADPVVSRCLKIVCLVVNLDLSPPTISTLSEVISNKYVRGGSYGETTLQNFFKQCESSKLISDVYLSSGRVKMLAARRQA